MPNFHGRWLDLGNEPHWVPVDAVIRFNEVEVGLTAETHHLMSRDLLESACAKPRNHYSYDGETDLIALAVILLFGIARNHAFEQGNKRTGFVAAVAFLNANGLRLTYEDTEDFGQLVEDVVERKRSEDEFREIITPFVVPV